MGCMYPGCRHTPTDGHLCPTHTPRRHAPVTATRIPAPAPAVPAADPQQVALAALRAACQHLVTLAEAYVGHPIAERSAMVMEAQRAVSGRTVAFLDASPPTARDARRRRAA